VNLIEFFEQKRCPFCREVRDTILPRLSMKYSIVTYDVEESYYYDIVSIWRRVCRRQVPAMRVIDENGIRWLVGERQIKNFGEELKELWRVVVYPPVSA